jgi:predicted AAA+ superfamily ATPase
LGILKTGSAAFSGNKGALLENFVYNSLRLETTDLYYFSVKSGGECDFIVEPHNGKPRCVQVCWELTGDNEDREIKGLLKALDFFDQEAGLILTRDTEDVVNTGGKKITVLPAWKYDFGTMLGR